jgi:carbonic anhydrase
MDLIKENSSEMCNCQRRNFLKLLLAGSFGLNFWLQSTKVALGSNKTKALVLTCIDFRFVDFEQNFLKSQNLDHEYDWLSLAGASLALADFPSHADTETFWEQLELSYKLHSIEKIIILDHQDCGAYGSKFDAQLSKNPIEEIKIHRQYLQKAYETIKQNYPNLNVELYFVHLDGKVETIVNV